MSQLPVRAYLGNQGSGWPIDAASRNADQLEVESAPDPTRLPPHAATTTERVTAGAARFCLIATANHGQSRAVTRTRCEADDGRVLVRAATTSELARRVWDGTRVTVAPCTRRGRALGPPIEVAARVVGASEERTAEAMLAARDAPLGRLRRWLDGRRGAESLYIELLLLTSDEMSPAAA